MKNERTFDHLKRLTKAEVIEFLKQEYFLRAPLKVDVDRFKEVKQREEYETLRKAHQTIDMRPVAKKHDELAALFRASSSDIERLGLLKQMDVLAKRIKAHHEEWERIDKICPF